MKNQTNQPTYTIGLNNEQPMDISKSNFLQNFCLLFVIADKKVGPPKT